ncbi:unnamed protein product [Vitrella brassicaformis CCMP3155]|uniref:Uncharacterized protein n=1 Tax=Vitrella brassicaformis (strain CCMP3155) TaxID=1169540 RepID=A0A0G4GX47_VITBC|nr:unnamed protein product [Vitrella brassicaformis CCMP3155]|eukprot:CEM35598.1 unnamed protein product [Vitrella brassicaformis CCMP3155]
MVRVPQNGIWPGEDPQQHQGSGEDVTALARYLMAEEEGKTSGVGGGRRGEGWGSGEGLGSDGGRGWGGASSSGDDRTDGGRPRGRGQGRGKGRGRAAYHQTTESEEPPDANAGRGRHMNKPAWLVEMERNSKAD